MRLQHYRMSQLDMAQGRELLVLQGMSCMVLNNPFLLCRSITLLIALSATREANVTSKIRSGPLLRAEPAPPADLTEQACALHCRQCCIWHHHCQKQCLLMLISMLSAVHALWER